jgi:FMN reductase
LGSTTRPGRLHRALAGAIDRAAERGTSADLLDLGTLRLGFADGTPPEQLADDTAATIAAIEAAKALIVATPVYRGSLTGSLKNLLDLTPVPALQGKVVGLVAMGASDHHFLGAERHLRDVLAFFGAVAMPVAVYLNNRDFEDGEPGERAATALDDLFAATSEAAAALEDTAAGRAPAPLAAAAIKPRAGGATG